MMYIKKSQDYFDRFKNKDIRGLSHLYSQNIRLTDWDIDIEGKEEVLNANSELFKSLSLFRFSLEIPPKATTFFFVNLEINLNLLIPK